MTSSNRPPVVLVHGMWGQPALWANWQQKLEAAGYSCHPVRLPYHYPGDKRVASCGLNDYVNAVKEVVRSLPEPPILIGHSLGGLITQRVAAETRLRAGVLVNTAAPGAIFPLRPGSLPGMARSFANPLLWRQAFKLKDWEASYLIFNCLPKSERPTALADLVPESGQVAYEVAFGKLNFKGTNRVNKQAIQCPLLAIAGQQDRIIPIAVSRRMADWYGEQLTYWEYPQHAHWLLGEPGWEEVVERLLKWLAAR